MTTTDPAGLPVPGDEELRTFEELAVAVALEAGRLIVDERPADLGRIGLALGRQVEALAAGEHAVAKLEDLGVGVVAGDRDADDVGGPNRAAGDPLTLEQ